MFYTTGVDISNTKSMWNFLHDHFQYYTMNSWNGSKSIANNVKLYNLGLEGDWWNVLRYLNDEADCGFLQMDIDAAIREFEAKHHYYKVGFNGRSGGYLVLYNSDNNCSVLPECVDQYDTYEDFKEAVKGGWNNYRVSDFAKELRDAVTIVREFDKLCDALRDIVNEFSKKSYDADKLAEVVDRFNYNYGDDLDTLELEPPVMEGDRVKLNDIEDLTAFMHCFMDCLGDDRSRVTGTDGYLWLKEA